MEALSSGESNNPPATGAVADFRRFLGDANSPVEFALAITTYVHLNVQRKHGAVASSGREVLERGSAVCGGMILAAAELATILGMVTKRAYSYGGLAAHSMLEFEIGNGQGLLTDPYHGLVYIEHASRPVSIVEIDAYFASEAPILFVRRSLTTKSQCFEPNRYLGPEDEDGRSDYAFPDIFQRARGFGLADSGSTEIVQLQMAADARLGNMDWQFPTPDEPLPWSALSLAQDEVGDYISWAYMLGLHNGVTVQQLLRFGPRAESRRLRLTYMVARALSLSGDAHTGGRPAIRFHPLTVGVGYPRLILLEPRDWAQHGVAAVNYDFVLPSGAEVDVLVTSLDSIVVQAIQALDLE